MTYQGQAGDSALLVEFGGMELDFNNRARVHALELKLKDMESKHITGLCPCIRSTMVRSKLF